jgi:hypothetical protein
MKTVITSGAFPGSFHAEPAGGRLRRWGPGGRVRATAVGAVLAVTAAVAALGPAGSAAASSGTSYAYAWGQGDSGQLGTGHLESAPWDWVNKRLETLILPAQKHFPHENASTGSNSRESGRLV